MEFGQQLVAQLENLDIPLRKRHLPLKLGDFASRYIQLKVHVYNRFSWI